MVKLWQSFSDTTAEKMGSALVMALEGKALEVVLELTDVEINSATGAKLVFDKLDTLYKKDELTEKFDDIEAFETYKRINATGMQEFIAQFDKLLSR